MDRDVPGEPLVLHALPGRLRVHLPGWPAGHGPCLERRLHRVRGVTHAEANPLTGNVLVLYDPRLTDPDALLRLVRPGSHATPLPGRFRRSLPFACRLARFLGESGYDRFAGLRLVAALLGLLAFRRLGRLRRAIPAAGGVGLALNALAVVQRLPAVRHFLDRLVGRGLAEWLRQVAEAASLLLSGGSVSLALAVTAALFQLSRKAGTLQPAGA
jgi:hypothetical protein